MSGVEPVVRAFIVQDLVSALSALGHSDAVTLELAASAGHSWNTWLPYENVLQLQERLFEKGEAQLVVDVFRASTRVTNGGKAMAALLRPIRNVLRTQPRQFFRWVPTARNFALRGAGTASYVEGEGGCEIVVHDMPSRFVSHAPFHAGAVGAYLGFLDFVGLEGNVDIERAGERVTYRVRWTRPLVDTRGPRLVDIATG